jgi:hypothetical protein
MLLSGAALQLDPSRRPAPPAVDTGDALRGAALHA